MSLALQLQKENKKKKQPLNYYYGLFVDLQFCSSSASFILSISTLFIMIFYPINNSLTFTAQSKVKRIAQLTIDLKISRANLMPSSIKNFSHFIFYS